MFRCLNLCISSALAGGLGQSLRTWLTVGAMSLAGLLVQTESFAQAGPYSRQAVVPGMRELAAEYRELVRDLDRFSALNYASLEEVRRTRSIVSNYDPDSVTRGWFAYHAMQVARQPEFHMAIGQMVDYMDVNIFLARIDREPSLLRTHPAMEQAVGFIMDAIDEETAMLAALEDLLASRMSDLHSARLGRRMHAKHSRWTTPADLVAQYRRRNPVTAIQAYPVIDRVLGLAARRTLNAVDGPDASKVVSLTSEKSMKQCVRFSKLNLVQCVAATRYPEEEAMCLGRYGMGELGKCWSWMLDS